MSKIPTLSLAATFSATLLWAALGLAQDPKPKDEALDKLLEKLDATKSAPAAPTADKPSSAPDKSDAPRAPGEVAPKDKALDSLLEKLGETKETPAPDDRPRGGHGPADEPPPPQPEKSKPQDLKGKEKDLDQHLEELTGRRPKKRDQGEGSGPLAQIIKEMREVEERLGKPDTGEETRKKQSEIVKNLETLIEKLRNSSSQAQGKKRYLVMKQGNQPGSKPGSQNPGTMGGNAPQAKPRTPNDRHSLAGSREEWGHLPPELRQEMENVFKEEALPSKAELIRRYYLSVSKKTLVRGE